MKKKINLKDIIFCLIPIVLFIIMINVLTKGTYIFGSQLDWNGQHATIPDIFRSIFYSTKDLLPDFAFNLGSGQNIYNISYYGYLSPIVLISYLFPKVNMYDYIAISTIITVLISTILLYVFLRKQKFSSEVSLLSAVLFITSSCISFHSHRHVMFINYMPFLILGLFGVDKKLDNNKGWLLSISVFLMLMTSYYFSIGGIVALVIYGIYKYLRSMKKVTFKSFMKTGMSFLLPIIIGICASAILTIPTFMTLLNNRAASNVSIKLKDLLLPGSPKSILYHSYGVGLRAIIIPALIVFFRKKKENLFLAITLSLIAIFPIFNYILNGTMYIDPKSLIPLLPLYIFIIANFLKELFENKLNYKLLIPITVLISFFVIKSKFQTEYFILDMISILIIILIYEIFKKKYIVLVPMIILSFIICFFINKADNFTLKETYNSNYNNTKEVIEVITENDPDFYRISNRISYVETTNTIYGNPKYYFSTIYSSISDSDYNQFYYDTINNEIPTRNRALTVSTENIFSLILTNNKYIVSQEGELHGYEKVYESDKGIKIYKNEHVLPLGYATSNVMSYEDFDKLSNPVANEALLNVIVADTKTDNNYVPNVMKTDLLLEDILKGENTIIEEDGSITIDVKDTMKFEYELPQQYQNKILFISFNMNKNNKCGKTDQLIKINNVKNKLTCSSWKYHNKNTRFDYVIAPKDLKTLYISMNQGEYNLSDAEIYYIDPAALDNVRSNVDVFEVDTNNTKGDKISGTIDVTKDGYFTISVPYDKGFNIKVDGNKVEYEKVNDGFVGFKINKGTHNIDIEYKAPYKNVGILISILGFIMFGVVTVLEQKRKF